MDSNNIDDLISVITLNTEIDEDTARSCILNELALVDALYQKDFLAELSNTLYKGLGNKVTKVEDIVKVSQEIQEKGEFITVAKARADREAEEIRKKEDKEAYVAEFTQYKEELDAKKAETDSNGRIDTFKEYKEDIENIYNYTKDDVDKTVIWLSELFGEDFSILPKEEQQQMAQDCLEGKNTYETIMKVAKEKGKSIEEAHIDVAIGELTEAFMDYYCSMGEQDKIDEVPAYQVLLELYKRNGKTEKELREDLSQMGGKYEVGGKAGQLGRERKIQEVKDFITEFKNGKSVDEIIEEKIERDEIKIETRNRLTEYEKFEEEISNNPNLTQEQKRKELASKRASYLFGYTSNISSLTIRYLKQIEALEKSLKNTNDEDEKAKINEKIELANSRKELLLSIQPTHRVTMIFDLDKKASDQIASYKEKLEKETDEAEKRRLTAIIAKLESNRINLKSDVRFEAIFGNKIDSQLKQVLLSKRREVNAKIKEATEELEEARRKQAELNQKEGVTEEERKESDREVRKHEIILDRYEKDKERYKSNDINEAFTDAEIFQFRRSFKKNLIKESIRDSKSDVSKIVKKLKTLDPNSREYIETVDKLKDVKMNLRVRLMECGEEKDDINALLNSYAFVSSKEILDVMYAETLNKERSISTSGLLIEQQGHTENKEMLCRIDECKKFAKYLSKKLCETTDPNVGLEGVIARHDVIFDALAKADLSGKKNTFDTVIDEMDVSEDEKKEYAEILSGYLETEPDPEKRRLMVKRLSYAPNFIPLRRATKYGIETEKEKSKKLIKDDELNLYFNREHENIFVSEIIVAGEVDQMRDTFVENHIQEEQPQPVPLGEEQASIKPTPVQNNSVLAGITAGTKESERIAAESEYSKLNPEVTKEDKSQENKESENEETK